MVQTMKKMQEHLCTLPCEALRFSQIENSSLAPDLNLLFQEFKFSFISRSCNRVAHTLAKQVTSETQVG